MADSRSARRLFPLKTIGDVCELFRSQVRPDRRPNLAMLSILAGLIESALTSHKDNKDHAMHYSSGQSPSANMSVQIPHITYQTVDALLHKFATQIKGAIDLSLYPKKTSRELIKKISDVIWSHLMRTYYKDKAHLQTIYSYLTGNKLDSFGVAYAVVAACQVLGLEDVHLAMSEDHSWVVFGDGETCEVTWHGKGNEDKRGLPIQLNESWLYLNGHAVICSRYMTVAALVSAMNPSINANEESEELAILQKELLWILYENNHLSLYPLAIGTLGDLEDVCPSSVLRKSPIELFYEGINVAKKSYSDSHVYPYTYLAGYLYRNGRFKEALKTWADAAQVVKHYNYTRDDEEIYKEFLEIANELIPHMVKVVSAGGREPSGASSIPLLQDPECFAHLLRFYDGLCGWEEGSSTPVLHIGWAKPLVATIAKFPHHIRAKVDIKSDITDESEEPNDKKSNEDNDTETESQSKPKVENKTNNDNKETHFCDISDEYKSSQRKNGGTDEIKTDIDESDLNSDASLGHSESELIKSLVKDIDSTGEPNPTIAALAAACSENILNPRFLLGHDIENAFTAQNESNNGISTQTTTQAFGKQFSTNFNGKEENSHKEDKPSVTLSSQKIAGLKHLLLADKLNTSAIQLQLTAQSQVDTKKRYRHSGRSSNQSTYSSANPRSDPQPKGGPEFDFVATTTTTLSRTSKRIRRE